jgi:hypothetical protein
MICALGAGFPSLTPELHKQVPFDVAKDRLWASLHFALMNEVGWGWYFSEKAAS